MAQLTERSPKVYRVQFKTHRSFSLTIRCRKGEAESFRGNLSRLEHLKRAGISPPADLLEWVKSLGQSVRSVLSESGLVSLGSVGGTLADLIHHAEKICDDLAPRTKVNHRQYHRSLAEFFGRDRCLTSITAGECDAFCRWLAKSYGPASVQKRIKHSRQIFNYAIRAEWLVRNPFTGIRVNVPVDQTRRKYITPEEAAAVMSQLRSEEDRFVFALARWAGFRVGSEVRSLHWHDIDMDSLTMRVWSPKTKLYRVCPVFTELQPWLPVPSEGLVCPEFCRNTDQFYRKKLIRAIKRADLEPWPDLLLNCRRSRATEVVDQFGVKAESDWIGHGPDISKRHYQMTLQEKIDLAVGRKLKTK